MLEFVFLSQAVWFDVVTWVIFLKYNSNVYDSSAGIPSIPPRMDSHAWTMTGRQERYSLK